MPGGGYKWPTPTVNTRMSVGTGRLIREGASSASIKLVTRRLQELAYPIVTRVRHRYHILAHLRVEDCYRRADVV